ncbi:Retinol dehydrogenase 8 [Holothuria leucospilota]|uniref:Retinol dehydrogenase 8 n=1 Tax=Holothuria leucospilota TaxID=206669 RepID=A0A9Q1H5E4_HOLLE|nr:Retinol dehydrogenase 8 [Holothuria leucospilota]
MEQMHKIFQTNFFVTARITQEVVRRMKKQRSGHIVFLSSLTGFRPVPFMEFYTASKHALGGMIGALAPTLHFFNVRVTYIQPRPVNTSIPENVKIVTWALKLYSTWATSRIKKWAK